MAGWIVLLTAWGATLAQGAPRQSGNPPGASAQALTVNGETPALGNLRLRTASNLDAVPPGQVNFSFTSDAPNLDFYSIQEIRLNDLSTTWLGSRPEALEHYRLGSLRNAIPPPPDWQHSINQIPPWSHTRATTDPSSLPFLNHAIFCWGSPTEEPEKEVGVHLFRQGFAIERPETVARATLRLAGNVEPLEAAFNEHPLHLGGKQPFAIAEFEVTPLLQGGTNIFAIKVRERPGIAAASCGLAFHLELVRREGPTTPPPPIVPTATLVTSKEGDRLWGRLRELRGNRVWLETDYGLFNLAWDHCTGVLFPAGWHPARPAKGLLHRVLSPGSPATAAPLGERKLAGLPLRMVPQPVQNCMLLTEGRMTTAKPLQARGDLLFFEGSGGKQYSLPLAEVLGLYPPQPATNTFTRPRPQVAMLYCQVATTSGEVVSGLLRDLDMRRLMIECTVGPMLKLPLARVASIHFPYHAVTLGGTLNNRRTIGLMAQVSSEDSYRDTYNADARQVQAAAFTIGVECRNLALADLADPRQLTPERCPVLVSIDPIGEYLHTYKTPGDAQAALVNYLDRGGVLIVLSRGGAFRTPVRREGEQLVGTTATPDLCRLLGLRTLRPGAAAAAGVTAFDHPPNTSSEFYFQRQATLPEGLGSLPQRIDLAPLTVAPFYPMAPQTGRGLRLYDLCDGNGTVYGPALSIVPHGRGMLMLIDHLLWESRVEEHPFSERVLPVILHRALYSVRP